MDVGVTFRETVYEAGREGRAAVERGKAFFSAATWDWDLPLLTRSTVWSNVSGFKAIALGGGGRFGLSGRQRRATGLKICCGTVGVVAFQAHSMLRRFVSLKEAGSFLSKPGQI